MTSMITITCAHCGAATDFDAATDGLPMDCFRCCSCGKVWKRCHGKPERSYSGIINIDAQTNTSGPRMLYSDTELYSLIEGFGYGQIQASLRRYECGNGCADTQRRRESLLHR